MVDAILDEVWCCLLNDPVVFCCVIALLVVPLICLIYGLIMTILNCFSFSDVKKQNDNKTKDVLEINETK